MMNEEKILNLEIENYYENKKMLDSLKEDVDNRNKEIKSLMQKLEINDFETDNGTKAKITTQKRESFIEDKLLLKLKTLGITEPIKTIEVIDYDELENAIYNNKLDASILTDCKQVKEVVTLKVTRRRGE